MKQLPWWLVSPEISLAILNHFSDRIPAAAIVRDRFALAGLQLGGFNPWENFLPPTSQMAEFP